MRHERHQPVQSADHYVKSHPQDKQPTRPVVTFEQKHAADNGRETGEINHPVMFEIYEALISVDETPRGVDQREDAKQNKEKTDNYDRAGAIFHAEKLT